MTATTLPFDPEKLHAAVGRFLGDVGSVFTAVSVVTGDRLGLYRALADRGPQTSAELAAATNTYERYVREWLANQAAAGYLTYDPESRRFSLPPEHVPLLADRENELNMCGLFAFGQPLFADEPKMTEAFRTGQGVGWHEHDRRLYGATDRIFRKWLRGTSGGRLAPRARGRGGQTAHRCSSGRPRLRVRQLTLAHGEGLPDVDLPGLRLPRSLD